MMDIKCTTLTGSEAVLTEAAITELRTSLRGPLLTPSDPGYDEARVLWNGMHDKRPALIARCTGVADVIAAVNFARARELLTAVRGGGHHMAGNGSCDGRLMIDPAPLKARPLGPPAKTAPLPGGGTPGGPGPRT